MESGVFDFRSILRKTNFFETNEVIPNSDDDALAVGRSIVTKVNGVVPLPLLPVLPMKRMGRCSSLTSGAYCGVRPSADQQWDCRELLQRLGPGLRSHLMAFYCINPFLVLANHGCLALALENTQHNMLAALWRLPAELSRYSPSLGLLLGDITALGEHCSAADMESTWSGFKGLSMFCFAHIVC